MRKKAHLRRYGALGSRLNVACLDFPYLLASQRLRLAHPEYASPAAFGAASHLDL